ncbi:YbaB/EbfC family nucleoid-associated protein [Prochlorococcus sp. MIT 1300]|uniref:YbaB/EbfC family nucleoid-associated protein n=1 Tax=Prochlorococcus sp. MIT 1300 TaxID=3096218 RepID=UPI002A7580EF|nr:YbaB/EbfC family nucleoid-associated protein [Prochlorococcus sp. MIT 1300]
MAAFGLPNFGQLTEAFRKAQQIQQEAQSLQVELDEMELQATDESKRVSVWISGNQKPLRIEFNNTILNESKETIEEATLEALQAAYKLSTTTMKERMEELTGGLKLNLPDFNAEN